MTAHAVGHKDENQVETVELPAIDAVQRALHEATGHLYDELATAGEDPDLPNERIPADVFDELEKLYAATAEEAVTDVRISYARE